MPTPHLQTIEDVMSYMENFIKKNQIPENVAYLDLLYQIKRDLKSNHLHQTLVDIYLWEKNIANGDPKNLPGEIHYLKYVVKESNDRVQKLDVVFSGNYISELKQAKNLYQQANNKYQEILQKMEKRRDYEFIPSIVHPKKSTPLLRIPEKYNLYSKRTKAANEPAINPPPVPNRNKRQ